ncbi:polyphenol oxidase family protein [Candidatus Gottesmanbacteria bacterium]|nr:polyphenol oxidase family protein [Candidatus Gottesmanbacteria bacterium]
MNKLIKHWQRDNVNTGTTTKLLSSFTKFKTKNFVYAQQVHSNKVVVVTNKDSGKTVKGADGLITNSDNLCLVIYTADCIPVFFYEPVKKIIALVHAGRKGSLINISGSTVKEMVKLGANVNKIKVHLGPHICKNCYEIDLASVNINQLTSLNILRSNISLTDYCTYEDKELFYSYRREKPKNREFDEMISYITLK